MEFGNSFSLDDIRDEVENYLEDLHLVPGSAMVDPEMSDLPGGSNINGRFRKSTLDPVEVWQVRTLIVDILQVSEYSQGSPEHGSTGVFIGDRIFSNTVAKHTHIKNRRFLVSSRRETKSLPSPQSTICQIKKTIIRTTDDNLFRSGVNFQHCGRWKYHGNVRAIFGQFQGVKWVTKTHDAYVFERNGVTEVNVIVDYIIYIIIIIIIIIIWYKPYMIH